MMWLFHILVIFSVQLLITQDIHWMVRHHCSIVTNTFLAGECVTVTVTVFAIEVAAPLNKLNCKWPQGQSWKLYLKLLMKIREITVWCGMAWIADWPVDVLSSNHVLTIWLNLSAVVWNLTPPSYAKEGTKSKIKTFYHSQRAWNNIS